MSDEKHSKLVAGLCYIPIFMINIIAIIYSIFVKKDDKYAKFHALQALSLFILQMVVVFLIMIPLQFLGVFALSSIEMSEDIAPVIAIMIMSVVFLLVFLLVLLVEIAIGIMVANGKDIRLPILAKFVQRFV